MTNEEIIETILSREKETKNTKRLRAFIQEALTLKEDEIIEVLDEEKENIMESKTYILVLEHRKYCEKWGKEFCMECFGNGLTKCREGFLQELRQKIAGDKK